MAPFYIASCLYISLVVPLVLKLLVCKVMDGRTLFAGRNLTGKQWYMLIFETVSVHSVKNCTARLAKEAVGIDSESVE